MDDLLRMLSVALVCAQGVIGLLIIFGAFLLLALGSDETTPARVRYPIIGLMAWGFWFAYIAASGRHDSPPALAFALAVAVVVLRYGRQIRGILDGEEWWPKGRRRCEPNAREVVR